ncbi:uncharacterized protein LOC109704005 [Ananas comosus]|uniref:Uncharacterized protein LOC109704005 n=1 Tax=Ananas comosus TaxID=4615 RepID=A0A6P5EAU4_ANACO|nr:uncharacterized protein LOC109704005 [Ananas comosus]
MSSSDAGVVDVGGDPPKQPSKWSKSRDMRITRESASLEDRFTLLEDIISKMGDRYTEMADSFNYFIEDRKNLIEELVAQVDEAEDLKTRVTILEKAVARGHEPQRESASKVCVPEPQNFRGTHDEKEIDNFLWHMEHYFKALRLNDKAEKVQAASMYLADDAMLWWRRRFVEAEKGQCNLKTWEDFVRELKAQFYPEHVEYLARKKLRRLKHTGTLKEYVKEYSKLMMSITSMAEEDRLFFFLDGLQPWANKELVGRDVKDVASAIALEKKLPEYERADSTRSKAPKASKAKGGGDRRDQKDRKGRERGPVPPQKKLMCYVYEPTKRGTLRLVNAVQGLASSSKPLNKELPYIDVTFNGRATRALVDTGATHNFVALVEAKRIGLPREKNASRIKAVNSEAQAVAGVTKGVAIAVGPWIGTANFTAAPIDDFQVILGMDFLASSNAVPMPHLGALSIMDEEAPCMPSAVSDKGLGEEGLPAEIKVVLVDFQDVMPKELPKQLPPRREVDHAIELEPGAKPPAKARYRMALPELEGASRCRLHSAVESTLQSTNLFDQLGGAKTFTKLDLCSGYYQVRIAEGDEEKTTCMTRYGAYEFLVMPFGLTNAPATFCTLMNKLFHPYLDRFMVVYLDDIVVYSNTLQEHIEHLRTGFQVLRENQLFVKKEKCIFAKEEVHFLGHWIGQGLICMDQQKVRAICE